METVNVILEYLSGQAVWWGLILVMLAAAFEYVFPPFPGDSVTLVAAVLIPSADWPVAGVFGAVMLGSVAGCILDWRVGRLLYDHPNGKTWLHRWLQRETVAERIEAIKRQFRKHGSAYIAVNRFVPAFRGLFFIAAGMTGLKIGPVIFWATVSAALWNAAILAVGSAVGYNLDVLVRYLEQYTNVVFTVGGIALILWVSWRVYLHVRSRR